MLEKDIQKLIVDYLRLMKLEVAVTDASRVWGKGGGVRASKVDPDHPDLTITLPVKAGGLNLGLAFYVEVKTPTGSIRAGQKVKLRALTNAGAVCIIARDLETVQLIVGAFKGRQVTQEKMDLVRQLLEADLADHRDRQVSQNAKMIRALLKGTLAR
jgi:hypothetical protein